MNTKKLNPDLKWTASQVRADFTYIRQLMRQADQVMRSIDENTDLSESSEVGQLALELIACSHSFQQWIDAEHYKREEVTR